MDIHFYARRLQQQKKPQEAIKIFELNAKMHPEEWITSFGMMRAQSAKGNFKEALRYGKIALEKAPNDAAKANVQNLMKVLEQGKDIN